jgi:phenylacetic acid degradation protein
MHGICDHVLRYFKPMSTNMPAYSIENLIPVVSPSAYVHPSAVLIGDVIVSAGCYVGPCAVLRGDFGRITLAIGSNVQDTCVMHSFPGKDCVVGVDGHIGHGAILHGCSIGRNALVGMNAVIMDNAEIGDESLVAACSFVKSGFICPPRSLVQGTPAQVVRELTAKEIAWKTEGTREYQQLTRRSLQSLREVEPLDRPQADRPRFAGEHAPKSED